MPNNEPEHIVRRPKPSVLIDSTRIALSLLVLPLAPAAGQNVLTVTARDYALSAPDTVAAGWTTIRFVNHDAHMHGAQVVRLDGGHTLEDFWATYREAWQTDGPRPAWGVRAGGVGAFPGGQSEAMVYLEPGSYGLYCVMDTETGVPHVFGRRMFRALTVVPRGGADAPPAPPEPTVTLTMNDYTFRLSRPLTAGHHVVRVVNEGVEPHEVGLLRLPDDMTADGLQRAFADYMEMTAAVKDGATRGPAELPPVEPAGGIAALAKGLEAYFETDLRPGAYVLICFVTAPDGRPHVAHGMVQYLRIESAEGAVTAP